MAANSFNIKSGVMNLEPLSSAPLNPVVGDMYVDTIGEMFLWDGNAWRTMTLDGSGALTLNSALYWSDTPKVAYENVGITPSGQKSIANTTTFRSSPFTLVSSASIDQVELEVTGNSATGGTVVLEIRGDTSPVPGPVLAISDPIPATSLTPGLHTFSFPALVNLLDSTNYHVVISATGWVGGDSITFKTVDSANTGWTSSDGLFWVDDGLYELAMTIGQSLPTGLRSVPAGSDGEVLTLSGGVPVWQQVSSETELSAPIADSQTNTDVTGMLFSSANEKAVTLNYQVVRTNGPTTVQEMGTIRALYREDTTDWILNVISVGDAGIDFSITTGGQVQYTSGAEGTGTINWQVETKLS